VIVGDEHTSRGLEYRTQEGAWARYENKRDAYNSVLDEQDRQWKVDKDDDDKICEMYLKHSTKCADAAVGRALQDEHDARKVLRSIMTPKQRKSTKPPREKGPRRSDSTEIDNAQHVLREKSSVRRTEVRDDIKRCIEQDDTKNPKEPIDRRTTV
jgi:hypothetical protein